LTLTPFHLIDQRPGPITAYKTKFEAVNDEQ
jgi:hypothetical protein